MEAAALEDRTSVARANGVGPKLAARIVTELKGRAPPASLMGTSATGSSQGGAFTQPESLADSPPESRREGLSDMTLRNQAISALANLGVGQPDALRAVASAYRGFDDDPGLAELVKAALKELGR
jgi:holliday junction DNA helicase RuvA